MPKLRTNAESTVFKPKNPVPAGQSVCTATYEEYKGQRVLKDTSTQGIEELTERFKSQISDPINKINPNLAMGEYFVIPVSEIKELLSNTGDTPEFIHIYNAVRETKNSQGELKSFPVAILVPVSKQIIDGSEAFVNCDTSNTVYVEAYPCPPAPGCPSNNSVHRNVLPPTEKLNDFNSLF